MEDGTAFASFELGSKLRMAGLLASLVCVSCGCLKKIEKQRGLRRHLPLYWGGFFPLSGYQLLLFLVGALFVQRPDVDCFVVLFILVFFECFIGILRILAAVGTVDFFGR